MQCVSCTKGVHFHHNSSTEKSWTCAQRRRIYTMHCTYTDAITLSCSCVFCLTSYARLQRTLQDSNNVRDVNNVALWAIRSEMHCCVVSCCVVCLVYSELACVRDAAEYPFTALLSSCMFTLSTAVVLTQDILTHCASLAATTLEVVHCTALHCTAVLLCCYVRADVMYALRDVFVKRSSCTRCVTATGKHTAALNCTKQSLLGYHKLARASAALTGQCSLSAPATVAATAIAITVAGCLLCCC
jgi:hypothetical protein